MVRVCVVGAEDGYEYARVLSRLSALAGIYDPDAQKAREYGAAYGVPHYTLLHEMLESLRPDGLVVATPADTHLAMVSAAVEHGMRGVFVARPLGSSFRECREIYAMAERSRLILMPGYLDRFSPILGRARELISNGRCGRMLMLEVHNGYDRGPSDAREFMYSTAVDGVDSVLHILSTYPDLVSAIDGVDGSAVAILLGFRDRRIACITSTRAKTFKRIDMVMERCIVRCDLVRQEMSVEGEDTVTVRIDAEPISLALSNFIDAVEGRDKPRITARDALVTESVADAALLSIRIGSQVYVHAPD
ncbi:MAG: Gfo/Idh/MocA family oxidoreductase [Candidatus Nitrosocaldus sp.]|nr:Gfo/Idh/MocA family oxidoreductase [Candidatus Nitrosocaldus sp.]MCS7141849.1 Gfo/Idh/MocA family oxidoreductase [Candidatus Nitrosocaldus sp.]MDW8000554.1 Gfo/Idh/MocA family oxidoreductase [Candidatus Nitrosocaldus sp.]MDW8275493.1 Gfo/Idh/MocA family oxidoreductase [Candidatus Nitrosocaldus sp.]